MDRLLPCKLIPWAANRQYGRVGEKETLSRW